MKEAKVASRYAYALLELAKAHNLAEQVELDLEYVMGYLEHYSELLRFFWHPKVAATKKLSCLNSIFSDSIEPLSLKFLSLLIVKRRLGLLHWIVQEYKQLLQELKGVIQAQVVSAIPLSYDEVRRFKQVLDRYLGCEVQIEAKVDPQIIGGNIIYLNDKVIDNSIRTKLQNLKELLLHTGGEVSK